MAFDPVAVTAGHFGIDGTASALPGYTDENWQIDADDGTRYVLKISAGDTALQDAVLEAVATTRFRVPSVVAATELDFGRITRLLTWVDGTAFADAGRPPEAAGAIGIAAGEIVDALSGLDRGEPLEPRDWDLANAPDVIRANAAAVPDEHRRAIVLAVADLLGGIDFERLPHQVIHNDLNDDNVLIAEGAVVTPVQRTRKSQALK